MDTKNKILSILDDVLNLNGRSADFTERTALLGAIPELDSMAVVALIARLEETFGFSVDDDEIDGATFATLGSLLKFVNEKTGA
ncbi:phosphopantetheine-binding protein [Propionivibrio soli]|uniref:phosphopantetheine-binding protein n=1 Tax=Propionivibrio soli TaxID=2976531 RepID=UPI0021E9543E|nr:phosphopantetheine-binding protein [Propionivibrio soli]